MSTARRHFAFLDGIRGWAAFGVLLFHLGIERSETDLVRSRAPQLVLDVLDTGKLGVAVFFVLSGLVIAYSLRTNLEIPPGDAATDPGSADRPSFDVGNFVVRRIVRLTPPYHAAIIVALLFALGASLEGGHEYLPGGAPFGLVRLFAHLIYAQELLGFVNFNDVFWTLAIELQFYLAFAVLVFAQDRLGRSRRPATTLQVLYGISAAISLLWPFGLFGDDARPIWFAPLWYSFMLGVLIFARWRRQIPAWPLALYMMLLAVAPLVSGRDGQFAWVSVGTTALLWIAVERDRLGRWLADRPSQFLGRVSYSLYLIHTPILGAVLVVATKLLGDPSVAKQLLSIVVGIVVSLVSAEIFYRAVERPAIMMSRRLRSDSRASRQPRNRRVTIMP